MTNCCKLPWSGGNFVKCMLIQFSLRMILLVYAGFELSISQLQNTIYFFIIMMLKKSHFSVFLIQIFVQNTEKTCEFNLYCWDHVCKVNEWCLVDCFHHEFRVSTQIKVPDYCIMKCKKFSAGGSLLMVLWAIFL